jgi:DHA2 family multidrug resistance protein
MLYVAAIVLALSNFMAILDTTIANVSVPTIAGGLAVSPSEGTWVITSYSVAEAITVPLTGWLALRFGPVRVFTVAVACFGLFSALCGLAPSLGTLVLFRILQGLSGGPMMPLSQTLMMTIFPPEKRAQAMGLWAMTAVVGPLAGPLLGGAILDHLSWPWIFYINVPVAVGIFLAAPALVARYETKIVKRPVDFVGLGLLILWVGALQIMLDKGEEVDWFNSPLIVALALTALVGFFAFIFWEITQADPIVNLHLFRIPAFAIACAVIGLTFGAFFASVVLVPLWLQTSMGYNASWSGRVMALQGVLAVLMAPVVAQLSRKVDPRALGFFGVMTIAVVMVMRAGLSTQATFWNVATPQILLGMGVSFFFMPLNLIGIGALKPEQIAAGSGITNFIRTCSGAIAVSLVTTNWTNGATKARVTLAGRLNADQTVSTMQKAGMTHGQALLSVDQLTQQQAVMLSTDNMFMVLAVFAAVAAFTVWLAPKPSGPVQMMGGGGH